MRQYAGLTPFLIGYALGIAGVGDGKDHLFTFTDTGFADAAVGHKWSEVFPGVGSAPRITHPAMVGVLIDAGAGDVNALNTLTNFVTTEAYLGGFDPAGGFAVLEWSVSQPDIPEPGTGALLAVGFAGVLALRRRRQANAA